MRTHDSSNFDRVFAEHLVGPGGRMETVGKSRRWKVGLYGVDTAFHADYAARGKIALDDLPRLENAAARADVDLNLLLAHHHLQSVRSLEARRQGAKDLLDVLSLVNAGTLLESLCRANINIALHGHQHASHWARYGSLERGQSECIVLGAASATGNDSIKGCDLEHASYNLIVLERNGAGRLHVRGFSEGHWADREQLRLFASADIGRWRLLRAAADKIVNELQTRVVKEVEYTRSRDIVIRRTISNMLLPEVGQVLVTNSSGVPVDPTVTITKPGLDPFEPAVTFARHDKKANTWVIQWTTPPEMRDGPADIYVEYTWLGGAILSDEEMTALRAQDVAPGLLRADGYEYSSVQTAGLEFRSADLFVVIAPELAPDGVTLRVFNARDRTDAPEEAKNHSLVQLAPGRFWLHIDYPRPDLLYALAWKPPMIEIEVAGKVSPESAEHLLEAFREGIPETVRTGIATALYVKKAPNLAQRVAVEGKGGPPETLSVFDARSGFSSAWGGTVTVVDESDGASQLLPSESAAIFWPLMVSSGWMTSEPWGVIRIGIRNRELAAQIQPTGEEMDLLGLFQCGVLRILTKALEDDML